MIDLRSTRVPPSHFAMLLAVWATVGFPATARAQQDCAYAEGTRSVQAVTLPGGGRIVYLSHPRFSCSDNVRISADSAVSYSQLGYSDLLGNVYYTDLQRTLRADNARYFGQQGRLQAHGSVFLEDTAQGSTIRHGDLIYLRQSETRKQEQITVTTGADGLRPHATLYMQPAEDTATTAPLADTMAVPLADTAREAPMARAAAPDTTRRPYDVVADRILLVGDQYFRATGSVVIERDSLHARSESAEYDQAAGNLTLQGDAHVESSSYDLTAERIDIGVPSGAIRDVRAVRHAVLVGEDLRLTSPLIDVFLEDGLLNRLVAIPLWKDSAELARSGSPLAALPVNPLASDSALLAAQDTSDFDRPVAVAEKFHLTADSLEVSAPDQELQRIFASGSARGTSDARDSLNTDSLPEVARKDWVEGDTVIVTFVPVPPDSARPDSVPPPPPGQDTARARYRVDRLVAAGDARSLYRLLPSDSTSRPGIDPPAVHYTTGTRITIVMKEGEVDRMEVEGPTRGWHLEPIERHAPDTTEEHADSLGHRSDTAAVRVDTSHAAPPRAATSAPPGVSLPRGGTDSRHDRTPGVVRRSEPADRVSGGWGER